jgi:hypothetical protein
MSRTIFKAKTSSVNRAAPSASSSDASAYCRDLDNWPRSWMGLEKDLPPGEELVACLRPFIEHLASSSLSPKTIRRHVDNLWILGGEIIRDLNYTPSLRKVAAQRLLRDAVHADGGPLFTTARKSSNTPSMRPAANSTASSVNLSAEPASYPQIPRTRLLFIGTHLEDLSNLEFHCSQADRGKDRVIRFANLCQTNS